MNSGIKLVFFANLYDGRRRNIL